MKELFKRILNLQLFSTVQPIDPVTKTTDLSPTMKTFYETTLLENARSEMTFTQLGDKQPMHGKTCEWRKFNTFGKALTPLTEGVIPDASGFGMTAITADTTQHGDYVAVTDRLEMESYDDVIFGATEEMGAAEGETFDTLTRNILIAGNSVAYAPAGTTPVASRAAVASNSLLTSDMIAQAATWLKKNKAPKIDGYYVAVIHPSQAYDLRKSQEWLEAHKYDDVAPIFNGEIGTLHGVRFIEDGNVKVWKGADLTAGARCLTVKTANTTANATIAVKEAIAATDNIKANSYVNIAGKEYKVSSVSTAAAGSATITLDTAVVVAVDDIIAPAGGGLEGTAVYGAIFLGAKAFGVLDPEGEGMEMIIKDKAQIGGPLNQFSTIGYKFCHGAKILYQERLLRVETGSSMGDVDQAN